MMLTLHTATFQVHFTFLHCHFFLMKSFYYILQLPLTTKLFYYYCKRVMMKTFFLVGKGMMNSALSVMP